MERIAQLIKKIQDVYYKPGATEVIDLDLMMDYTRVLYADLLEERTQKLASQGMGLHLTQNKSNQDSGKVQSAGAESELNSKPDVEFQKQVIREESSIPVEQKVELDEEEEVILNLGGDFGKQNLPSTATLEDELDLSQEAERPLSHEEDIPRLNFDKINNRNKVMEPSPILAEIELEAPAMEPRKEDIKEEVVPAVEPPDSEETPIEAAEEEPETTEMPSLEAAADKVVLDEEKPVLEAVVEETIEEAPKKVAASPTRAKDIRSFIGINDKYQFMNELFANNKTVYEETLNTIAQQPDVRAAELWLLEDVAIKNNWDLQDETFLELLAIVKRYFTAV